MSIAEAWRLAAPDRPAGPPPAGAAVPAARVRSMTAIGRMVAMRNSAIGTWGQRAYEEDIIQGRFFGRSSFILNAPDAIRHVLVDNYENYTRTPAAIRVLRPVLGEGLLIAEGRSLEASAPHAGAGLHAARGDAAGAAHDRGDRRDHRESSEPSPASRSTCARPCSG